MASRKNLSKLRAKLETISVEFQSLIILDIISYEILLLSTSYLVENLNESESVERDSKEISSEFTKIGQKRKRPMETSKLEEINNVKKFKKWDSEETSSKFTMLSFFKFFLTLFKFILSVTYYYNYRIFKFINSNWYWYTFYFLLIFILGLCSKNLSKNILFNLFDKNMTNTVCSMGYCSELTYNYALYFSNYNFESTLSLI